MVDIGTRYGIPTLAATAVGKDMARDARCSMLDARCWMLDTGCSMLDARCWLLVTGFWFLATKRFKVGIGYKVYLVD